MLSGWGNRPKLAASLITPALPSDVMEGITNGSQGIPRGLGRSYGDSALASTCFSSSGLDYFIGFDQDAGIIQCEAGVSLAEVLKAVVPYGWFLPVTPGTKFVTIGGAIASDVHGKNHHIDGCFSEFVNWFDIVTADGQIQRASRTELPDLFHATCGGMGLTGIIVAAELRLRPIQAAQIQQTTIKTQDLKHTLDAFSESSDATYSVAWIDCLAGGKKRGRCILTLGEHAEQGELSLHRDGKLAVPFSFPNFALNSFSVKAFNTLYYGKVLNAYSEQVVHYDPYFYPLDGIHHWNRIYGSNGFIQYQFVVPYESGYEALASALKGMSDSGLASFLAVLKHLGPSNKNLLSFPMEGFTLAVDFKWNSKLPRLLQYLDDLVKAHGGRIYLTKDSQMSADLFRQSYTKVEEFMAIRKKYGADKVFNSLQSQRLGL